MSAKPGSNAKSVADQLEADNKNMAARLQQLKLTLKKQKQQRGGKAKGVIWRSASTTRSGIRTVEKGAAGRRRPHLPGSGGKRAPATAGKITTDQIMPHPPSTMPTFKAAPPPARPASVNNPADMLELKGAESDVSPEEVSGGDSEDFDENAGHAGFLAALNEWRTGVPAGSPPKQQKQQQQQSHGSSATNSNQAGFASSTTYEVGGGISGGVGTDSGNSLADGEYDEAASAAAFRAAVAEWRTGGEPAEPAAAPAPAPARANAPAKGMWSMPADPVAVQSFETQTQPAAAHAAPNTEIKFKTGSNLTYMERLMLAKHRKQGGNSRPVSGLPAGALEKHLAETATTSSKARAAAPAAAPTAAAPAAAPTAEKKAAYDPEGWLEPLAPAGYDAVGTSSNGSKGFEISEVLEYESAGNAEDGAATPFEVEQPADSSSDEEGGGAGPAVQIARPSTASRTFRMTPDGADADTEMEELVLVEVEEYFEEDESGSTAATPPASASPETPTRATYAVPADVDATPLAAAPRSAAAASEESASDDSEAEEMAAAMAAEISAQVESAAIVKASETRGSPHRNIITPGMMHDFEEMEEKMALI